MIHEYLGGSCLPLVSGVILHKHLGVSHSQTVRLKDKDQSLLNYLQVGFHRPLNHRQVCPPREPERVTPLDETGSAFKNFK